MLRCETRVRAISGGQIYYLNDIGKWFLSEFDGLGLTGTTRLSQRSPFQDGDTDLGYRRSPRFITLVFQVQGCTNSDLWYLRGCLLQIFRPRDNDPVQLTFFLPHGQARSADVYLDGGMDFVTIDRNDPDNWRVACVVKASDPRLYNPSAKTETFQLINTTGGWDVGVTGTSPVWADDVGWDVNNTPGVNGSGWNISAGTLNTSKAITYAPAELCDVPDYEFPFIYIYGPITSPIITNVSTNEKLDFSNSGGLVVGATDIITIDLRYGRKTVIDGTGASVDEYLTTDSDLFSWHFAYEGELLPDGTRAGGTNLISVTGTLVTLNTKVVFSYFDRYAGA